MSAPKPPNRWGPLWPLGEALRFLTIVPVGGLPPASTASIGRALAWFPLAGALLGLLLVGLASLCSALWGGQVPAVASVVGWGVLTAGLHLDGLSDTFDAVLSWRPRERKLEIMKDSRIGVLGALALIAVLALKVALLGAAAERWLVALLLAPVLGRWALIYGICWFPPASASGLGHSFHAVGTRASFWYASAGALALALLLAGPRGLAALLLVAGCTHLLGRWWTRDLGGLTGDTYGALCEIAEVVALAVVTAGSGR